jgi:hypothetical protein
MRGILRIFLFVLVFTQTAWALIRVEGHGREGKKITLIPGIYEVRIRISNLDTRVNDFEIKIGNAGWGVYRDDKSDTVIETYQDNLLSGTYRVYAMEDVDWSVEFTRKVGRYTTVPQLQALRSNGIFKGNLTITSRDTNFARYFSLPVGAKWYEVIVVAGKGLNLSVYSPTFLENLPMTHGKGHIAAAESYETDFVGDNGSVETHCTKTQNYELSKIKGSHAYLKADHRLICEDGRYGFYSMEGRVKRIGVENYKRHK